MHNNIGDEMISAGIAEEYEEPMFMDKADNVCSEKHAFGFKASHNIMHPDCFIMADEVGGNASQKVMGMQEEKGFYVKRG